MTVLFSEQLRELVIAALKAANTLAGANVFAPRDTPLASSELPAIMVDDQREDSESRGNAGFPAFLTTAILLVEAKVERETSEAVKADLSTLRRQIKVAILTDWSIVASVEQVVGVRTETAISAEGKKHVGELRMQFAFRYPEDFEPVITDQLDGLDVHADLLAPFDPTGVYPDAPFPEAARPAPRTSGPDGRDEAALSITF
jgi:hypothetical protein